MQEYCCISKVQSSQKQSCCTPAANKSKFFRSLGTRSNKDFWKVIKLLNNQQSSIPTLNHNGVKVESSLDKAVLLNTFFYECFNKSVPPFNDHQPYLDPSTYPEDLLCTEDDVLDLISDLDCNKSSGPDDISAKMLKGTATSIAPSLTRLFNLLLSTQ